MLSKVGSPTVTEALRDRLEKTQRPGRRFVGAVTLPCASLWHEDLLDCKSESVHVCSVRR